MARVFPSSDHAKQQKVFVKGQRASFENILHVNRMKELEQKDSFVNLLYRDTFLWLPDFRHPHPHDRNPNGSISQESPYKAQTQVRSIIRLVLNGDDKIIIVASNRNSFKVLQFHVKCW